MLSVRCKEKTEHRAETVVDERIRYKRCVADISQEAGTVRVWKDYRKFSRNCEGNAQERAE